MSSSVNNQKYLGVVYQERNELRIMCIDPETEEVVYHNGIQNLTKDYLHSMLPRFHQEFKAIFVISSESYKPAGYESSYEFWKDLKNMLDTSMIPNHFFTRMRWYLSALLSDAEYTPTIDDIVLFITTFDDEVNAITYKYTDDGYVYMACKDVDISNAATDEYIRDKLVQLCPQPAAVILKSGAEYMQRLKQILQPWTLYAFVKTANFLKPKYAIEQYKWFLDKSYTKFYVHAITSSMISLFVTAGSAKLNYIVVPSYTTLPFNRVESFEKIVRYCNVSMDNKNEESSTILETWLPEQNAHYHEISFSVDEEGFIDYQVKGIILPHLTNFCPSLSVKMKSAVPVITFVNNLSFICVQKSDQVGYEFLQRWNGSLGTDLYISFDEEKPQFCQDALKAARENPTFVVHDIFSLMYGPPENEKKFKDYQFQVTKDDENPLLLEFDTYDGTRKLATPAFLMAMFLKRHIKAIKEEVGEKPKELAFYTFANLDDEEKERYQRQMIQACEMLNISCTFS